jgi:outer membrane receptor protein involved in Fe transport
MRPGLITIRLGKVYALMALVGALGATALSQTNQSSQTNQAPENQLKQLSLEQLGDIEVTTQAKAPVELWKTPAAVYVITQEDIRRSGATTIPEALRLAPGVEVARISADKWSIGIRGFGSRLNRDAGADGWAKRVHHADCGNVLGSARHGDGRYRPDRGDSRARRNGVGPKCSERGNQHHHQEQ